MHRYATRVHHLGKHPAIGRQPRVESLEARRLLSGQTWQLADLWSDLSNPFGAFQVGRETATGVFAPFTFNTSTPGPNSNLNYLSSSAPAWVPSSSGFNSPPGLFRSAGDGALDAPAGTVGGRTPSGLQGSGYIVRWTAPVSATVHLEADLWNLAASGNFNRYEVRHVQNSTGGAAATLREGGVMLPAQGVNANRAMPVAVPAISVVAGDFIDFFVARADGFSGEMVGFDLSIGEGAADAPEPNYLRSAAADFYADFSGGLPRHNPNGDWAFLGPNGQPSDLEPHNDPGSVAGAGAGWRVRAAAGGGVLYSYARGNSPAFSSAPNTILGHGPMVATWTAPPEIDLGGVTISGLLTQADFEAARQMALRIFKNDSADPLITVDANFANQRAIVPLPPTTVAMEPGDVLTIIVDGSGPQGNGVPTFAAWDVIIEEFDAQMQADFNRDYKIDAADLDRWRTNVGLASGADRSQGDADGDADVDGGDFLVWQRQLGNAINSGFVPFVYHPGAIVVQTSGVTLPSGAQLDVAGSQTQGLQEAFDYSAAEGFDVFVLPGAYNLNAHLDVEELQGRAFRFEDVTLNFSPNVTDFGVRFDSTMITDWYWKGGALNAPQAESGVLFQPRTPHPLDGEIYHTVGVVDSRFDFGVDIVAKTYKVTMNTTQAAVNDAALHFKGLTRRQVHYVGPGFSPTNIFSAARTDDPIPFDLFDPSGRVTVIAPIGEIFESGPRSTAIVVKPDGARLSTLGTTTSGLKEAFDYAAVHNLDLLVFGRGVRNVDPHSQFGYYNTANTITVGSLANRTYEIYSVTFNYTGTGVAMEMSDAVASQFELTGQIVAVAGSIGVRVRPQSSGVISSKLRIQHVVGSQTNVLLDPSLRTIENSEFHLHEMNIGRVGIKIANPSPTTYFRNNFIRTLHTHAMSEVGVQVGDGPANAGNIQANTFEIRTALDFGNPGDVSLQVWGANNNFDLMVFGPKQNVGVRFESSSSNNWLLYGPIYAATPIINLGTGNTLQVRSAAVAAALATTESPSARSIELARDAAFAAHAETTELTRCCAPVSSSPELSRHLLRTARRTNPAWLSAIS
ncbi:MAG: hypothetical protein IT424_07075 [Pirellulales bacterium]|nr:hypothetical protein [Pirellulales bacterium]